MQDAARVAWEAHGLFRSLCYGADGEFLAAADTGAERLVGQIDR